MDFIIDKLKETFGEIISILPSLVGALVVLLLGWIFAKTIAKVLERILVAIQIDKLAEKINNIDIVEKSSIKIKPSLIIPKFFYYLIMLIVLALSAELMALNLITVQVNSLIEFLPDLVKAIGMLILGLVAANMVKGIVSTSLRSMGMSTGGMIGNFIFYFLFISVILMALKQIHFETKFITDNLTIVVGGVMAAFAIGYGYASRGVMANFLSSLYSKPKFRIGEVIKVKETKGTIIGMDNTAISLRTAENKRVFIPLYILSQEKVEVFESWDEGKLIDTEDVED